MVYRRRAPDRVGRLVLLPTGGTAGISCQTTCVIEQYRHIALPRNIGAAAPKQKNAGPAPSRCRATTECVLQTRTSSTAHVCPPSDRVIQHETPHPADSVAAPERGGGPKGRRGDPVGTSAQDALDCNDRYERNAPQGPHPSRPAGAPPSPTRGRQEVCPTAERVRFCAIQHKTLRSADPVPSHWHARSCQHSPPGSKLN